MSPSAPHGAADATPAAANAPADTPALTRLLHSAQAGDTAAADAAYRLLYPELLKIARSRLRVHQAPTLLDTEALVHESFLRFVAGAPVALESRRHFYAYAAKAMRHIVVDFVRRAQAQRRGGDQEKLSLDSLLQDTPAPAAHEDIAALDEALQALQRLDPALAELVELRFYGGYTDAEIAAVLSTHERAVRRQWDKARAFLLLALR